MAVCIDEVHSTVQNYESFRPEFKTSVDCINNIVSLSRGHSLQTIYVPILVMSATFTLTDQQAFNGLIGHFPTIVLWGGMGMNRLNISLNVQISGNPVTSIMKAWTIKATQQPTQQSLIYSNSAAVCDGQIINRLSSAAKHVPHNNGKFLALTGDCGLMLKSFLMASFCGQHMDNTVPLEEDAPDSQFKLPTVLAVSIAQHASV